MQRRLGLDLEVSDEFGYWMAGFTDGEGHFGARIVERSPYRELNLSFEIKLRADDQPILSRIRDILGVGRVYHRTPSMANPVVMYTVYRTGDLYHVIIPLFEKYPLQAKKSIDFRIWKQLVSLRYQAKFSRRQQDAYPQSYWDKIELLINELRRARKFN